MANQLPHAERIILYQAGSILTLVLIISLIRGRRPCSESSLQDKLRAWCSLAPSCLVLKISQRQGVQGRNGSDQGLWANSSSMLTLENHRCSVQVER